MKKDLLRRMFVHPLKTWLKACAVPLVLGAVLLLTNGTDLPIYYVNAFSVAGALTIGVGLLSLLGYLGAFDTFGYSFSTFKGKNRKYSDMYEYNNARAEKRSKAEWTFVPYLLVGAVFLACGIVINVIGL